MTMKFLIIAAFCWLQASAVPGFPGFPGAPGGFGGFKAFGGYNKQIGLTYALQGMKVKAAQNEVKAQLDALKTQLQALPEDNLCRINGEQEIAEIENELLTAFDKCSSKVDMENLRLQALGYKQQFANFKLSKKACKLSLDPVTCMNDAVEELNKGVEENGGDVATGVADITKKNGECVDDAKADLLERISDAAC